MVFFSHRRGTKATYLLLGLFFFLRWHFGGGQKLPLIIPPTGPTPSTGSIQLPRRLFLPTSTTNNKKYTLSGWSHQWTTRLLREALSELCKRAPDGHDDSKSHGTLPYPNVQTTVYQNRGQIR